jgi:hypothetical protein
MKKITNAFLSCSFFLSYAVVFINGKILEFKNNHKPQSNWNGI